MTQDLKVERVLWLFVGTIKNDKDYKTFFIAYRTNSGRCAPQQNLLSLTADAFIKFILPRQSLYFQHRIQI